MIINKFFFSFYFFKLLVRFLIDWFEVVFEFILDDWVFFLMSTETDRTLELINDWVSVLIEFVFVVNLLLDNFILAVNYKNNSSLLYELIIL